MKLFYFTHKSIQNEPAIPDFLLTFYELTCVFNGSIDYYINNKRITLKAGDILFVRKGFKRQRPAATNCHYVSFNFYEDEPHNYFELPLYIKNGITKEIQLLLTASIEIYSQNTNHDDDDRLQLLCLCILKQLKHNHDTSNYGNLTKQITHYIHSHLTEKITLEDISRLVFFSPSHCSLVFKKEMGKTIINYILDEKIKYAKKLIVENVPLKTVAQTLGFEDYNYFSRTFKKRESITPLQYRQLVYSV